MDARHKAGHDEDFAALLFPHTSGGRSKSALPHNGHPADEVACPLSANSDQNALQQ